MSARGSSAWASSADSAKTKKKKNRGADKKDGANTFSLVTTPGRVVTRDADDDDDELLVLGETNEAGEHCSPAR